MKWIIDTDPGVDDAAALIAALNSDLDVLGVTVSYGNVSLQQTLINALRIKDLLNSPVGVYKGASQPLLQAKISAGDIHGNDGLGDLEDWPALQSSVESAGAVEFIRKEAEKHKENLSIITLGPLTNIALALALDRSLSDKISQLIIMGGTIRGEGNTTFVGEFNFVCDPEAAAMVLDSNIPIKLVPWEMTVEAKLLAKDLKTAQSKLAKRFKAMATPLQKRVLKKYNIEGYILSDLIAVALALNPELAIKEADFLMKIETAGNYSRGLSVIDHHNLSNKSPNVTICQGVDVKLVTAIFLQALQKGG